jgi:phosphoglycolate phosphatase-like HAD superfamily hydrolase
MAAELNTPVVAEGLPITFRDRTVWRDPETFDQSYLIALDFDETCYTTFISHGDGIAVHEAYEVAVETVLGEDARQDFSSYNGLSNRAPLDVIQGLIEREPVFIARALQHARDHFAHPEDITDIGLGLVARFADRGRLDHDDLTIRAITEMLVIRKKEKLIPQISEEWPQPVEGFPEIWTDLNAKKAENEKWKRVHFAIVSSGHTDFIQKVLTTAGLPHPDVYMTDDEMRRQVQPRTKPDPYALQLVRNAWMNEYLVPSQSRESEVFMREAKSRQTYIGDDPNKDGEMASNDGVEFLLHDGRPDTWEKIGGLIIKTIDNEGGFGGR